MARGRGGRGGRRGGRRGGQGNKGRRSSSRSKSKSKSRSKSRGASSGRRGGQGNRGRTSTSRNAASNKGRRGGTGKRGASTGRRGGQGNRSKGFGRAKGTVSRKSVRRSFRSVRKALGRVAKHTNPGLRGLSSVARALSGTAKAATAAATNKKKKQSKLQKQFANFRKRWQQMSTPEAKKERRMRRLYNQHGLDYSRMKDGLTIKANVGMALNREHKIPGTNIKVRVPKSWVKRIPQRIKNWKFNYTFKSPTKLGARDGWYRGKYNSTGKGRLKDGIGEGSLPMDPAILKDDRYIITKTGSRKPPMGPQQDWLGDLYRSHNIAGGTLDQGARDYWSNEAKTKGRDATIQSIIGTSKAQGTYGGRKKPRRIDTGDGMPKAVPLPWFGERKIPKQYQTKYKGRTIDSRFAGRTPKAKHTRDNRRMIKSLAGIMAGIRGGV